jgi:hypothetical protein
MIFRANCRRSDAISSKIPKYNSIISVPISKNRISEAFPTVPHCPDFQTKREAVRAMARRCKSGPLGVFPPGIAMISMAAIIRAESVQKRNDQLSDQMPVIHKFAGNEGGLKFRALKFR